MPVDDVKPGLYRVALAAAFLLLAIFAVRQIGSPDLGFHLRAGASILEGAGWPRTDTFTFTVRDHAYIDTSWGFQVLATAVHGLFGVWGLLTWQVVTALLLFFAVYRTTRLGPVDPVALVLLFLTAIVAVEIRIDVRPEWLSYLLLAATLHILVRHERGLRSPLWLLPLIQLLWVNVHSLFVLGWGAMACFVVGSWFKERRVDRRLLAYCAVALPVTLVNPYGYEALLFPLTLVTRLNESNVFASTIGELFSVFAVGDMPFYPRLSIHAARLLLLLVALSTILHFRARRFSQVLLALAFAPLAAQAVRNVPLLIVACLPGMVAALPLSALAARVLPAPRGTAALQRGLLVLSITGALLLGARVANDGYYIADRRQARFGLGWNGRLLPVQAADWVASANLGGRMLNDLGFGGYLMWRLEQPVFIDGRLEVMGEAFFKAYNAALASPAALDAAAARYGIDWVLLPHRSYPTLIHALTREPQWQLAYVDAQAVVYVRRGASSAPPDASARRVAAGPHGGVPLAELPGLGAGARRAGLSNWVRGLVSRQSFPTEDYGLGQFHYSRAEMAPAEAHFSQAIHDSGGAYPELYNNLGAALLFQGRRDDARRALQVVLAADPNDAYAKKKLAELGNP